jgi:ubiquinone/menaquinone biosynthesis C-methylase UbiE
MALDKKSSRYGSQAIPLPFAAPYRYAEMMISGFHLQSPEKLKFLDLCCGTGIHSIYPAKREFNVYGIDISAKSIEAAKQLASKNHVSDRCTFIVEDATQIDFPDSFFDIVFISGSLYYLHLNNTLIMIDRLLKKGGMFCCIETYKDNRWMRAIRFWKNIIRKNRDEQTMNNLMGRKEIERIEKSFSVAQTTYFDFFTLFGILFSWNGKLFRGYNRFACKMDNILLNKLKMSRFSFKFVISAIK